MTWILIWVLAFIAPALILAVVFTVWALILWATGEDTIEHIGDAP